MAPAWEALTYIDDLDEYVSIADIECEMNRESCKKYKTDSYPKIFWIDNKNNIEINYDGTRNLEHMLLFVKKQLNFPLIPINESQISSYIKRANTTTVFVFTIPPNDKEKINSVRNVSTQFRDIESHFLLIDGKEDVKPSLTVYTDINRSEDYNGEWDIESLTNFVLLHSLPFFVEISSYVMKHLTTQKLTALIYLTNTSKEPTSDAISICDKVSKDFIVSKTNCEDYQHFCRYIGVKNASIPKYVLYNRAGARFWIYQNESIIENDVLNWVKNVKNGVIKGSGPGTGFGSSILAIYYNMRGQGTPTFVFFLPLLMVFCVALMVWDNCSHREKIKKE
ncbi:Thioredoxin family protein [Histomonas meleagridis]|uniref:Thioredoxin family protein n=1 Tax=Histomonas meleagridis TaxID=135588 RepID=UPI00355AA955|nr:Thioredoxin family protein [Histomonas meleagridis]KAH0800162.1 Thioredoxin family protein [Histomonas meleagridis]